MPTAKTTTKIQTIKKHAKAQAKKTDFETVFVLAYIGVV